MNKRLLFPSKEETPKTQKTSTKDKPNLF